MKDVQDKKNVPLDKMKNDIVKLQQIDRKLIPQYLDNIMEKNNIKAKQIQNGENNNFLKYML